MRVRAGPLVFQDGSGSHVRLSGEFKFTTSGKVGEEGVERVEDGGPCAPPQAPRNQPSLTLPAPSFMTHDRAALPGRCDVLGREKGAFVN